MSSVADPPSRGQTPSPRRPLVAQLARPVRSFLATESGSAGLLLAATIAALLWANSPLGDTYDSFWATELSIRLGDAELREDLRHWVNDGLMVFFFFVVGLEVRRELAMGELTDPRRAAVPAVAAIAGLAVPAVLYLALNPSGEEARAWGVVMSTDTAFVLGALLLIGPAFPTQLRVFLLTLAIVDDVGALTVVALVYSEDVALGPLAVAAACVLAMLVAMRLRLRVWRGPAYSAVGLVLWIAMVESGVHPTIAGVVLALVVVVHPPKREAVERAARLTRAFRQSPSPALARSAKLGVEGAVSPNERLQELLHPWTSYLVVPVFALANAGVALDGDTLQRALASSVTQGVVLGLVVGKFAGIGLATALAVRLGVGRLPRGLGPGQVAGGAALAGIGFTVSLFIVDLALETPSLREEAKIGVLAASVLAAALGWAVFRLAARLTGEGTQPDRPVLLDPPVDPARDHLRGPADAPLTLVEYADFECPFCGRATGTVEEVLQRLGDRVRYVFRHLPLTDVHPHATLAAAAAEAAGAQGRFWEMHDHLFAHQHALEGDDLLAHAERLGLDMERFTADLDAERHARRVREDVESAEASGAAGTPTFFVNGRRHTGPYDAVTLVARLEA